ncbi:MAG: serine/threonine-protein kinase [Cyanobacteriota/Melainabacteria group bacterium]
MGQESTFRCLECDRSFNGSETHCPFDNTELVAVKQDELIGKVFADRYQIIESVGRGGMSVVYRAQHKYIERVVAIKLLHRHLVDDSNSVKRFQREARAASSLTHQNIISVYDFGVSAEGDAFIVMDYLEGRALDAMLDQGGPLPEHEAIDIIRQVCKGLIHAHKKGIIHRDLKPANLMLTVDEDNSVLVKIVDFGIAKVQGTEDRASQHLTRTGQVFGSPLYMSPEQWGGQSADARSDIYSLGCLMYELLLGAPPFCGKDAIETMSMHLDEKPLSFKEFNPDVSVSDEMESLVLRCLEKKPDKRFRSVADLLHEMPETVSAPAVDQGKTAAVRLVDLLATSPTGTSVKTGQPTTLRKRSRFHLTYEKQAKLSTTLLLLLLGFVFLYQGPLEDPGPPASKMIWQLELSLGESLMAASAFSLAVPVLELANWNAIHLDPIFNRPNYEKRFQTMTRLAGCYQLAGKNSDFERILAEYTTLDRERWELLAKKYLGDVDDAEDYIKELRSRNEPIQGHLTERRLNLAPSVKVVVELARRLEANYSYELEYQLLFRMEKAVEKLYGPDFIGLAELKNQRANCLKVQDRIRVIETADPERGADGLYGSIKAIYEVNLRQNLDLKADAPITLLETSKDPGYIRSILALGQWQRRIGKIDLAEKNIKLALDAAKTNGKFRPDEIAEFYTSYGNVLVRLGRAEEAKDCADAARCKRQDSAKELGMPYIEHKHSD